MRPRTRTFAIVALLALCAWVGFDLLGPTRASLRTFDPNGVARLETVMWRSYYDRKPLPLYFQLAELLRTEYGLPLLRSHVVAFHAAKAAFVFKRGRRRADYELALPDLDRYYREILRASDTPFDVHRAAKLELEWWIVHRQREQHDPADLVLALAELQAEIYRLPVETMQEHARLRAEAMTIRDDRAAAGGVTEADWARIEELLRGSFGALSGVVRE